MTSAPQNVVVVLHAFGPYSRGELLSDPAVISAILAGGHAGMVVRTQLNQGAAAGSPKGEEH